MANEIDELRNLFLENLKMHAQTRYAVKLLKLRVDMLENALKHLADLPVDFGEVGSEMAAELDKATTDLDDRFDGLLSAMERYSNG